MTTFRQKKHVRPSIFTNKIFFYISISYILKLITGLLFTASSQEFVKQWHNITSASMAQLQQMMIYLIWSGGNFEGNKIMQNLYLSGSFQSLRFQS